MLIRVSLLIRASIRWERVRISAPSTSSIGTRAPSTPPSFMSGSGSGHGLPVPATVVEPTTGGAGGGGGATMFWSVGKMDAQVTDFPMSRFARHDSKYLVPNAIPRDWSSCRTTPSFARTETRQSRGSDFSAPLLMANE